MICFISVLSLHYLEFPKDSLSFSRVLAEKRCLLCEKSGRAHSVVQGDDELVSRYHLC